MKKESRVLYLFSKDGLIVGFLLRGRSFDRVYIGCHGGDFIERIQSDSAFKQTRKVYYLEGSDLPVEFKILGGSHINREDLYSLAVEIVSSLKRLGGEKACISAQGAEA